MVAGLNVGVVRGKVVCERMQLRSVIGNALVQQGVAQGCSYIHACVYQWSLEGSGLGMELIQGGRTRSRAVAFPYFLPLRFQLPSWAIQGSMARFFSIGGRGRTNSTAI